jgi:microcystin-dependent protein
MANIPTLSTSADLSASQTAGAAVLVMPTGVILPYGGTSAPTGWLACDGTAISRTTYASLFASIGTSFGVGDGSTTFNLPDLRGRFPRFNDRMFAGDAAGAAGRDTGRVHGSAQAQATAPNGITATASPSAISGTSGSAGAHSHTANGGGNFLAAAGTPASTIRIDGSFGANIAGTSTAADHTHSISGTAAAQSITIGGDAETRPINLAISAIIKI